MNIVATAAFIGAAVLAVADWWSRARQHTVVEYVCKPATLAALLVAAVALDPAGGNDDRRAWFVAAAVFSLAGDVFLMLPSDRFVAGLASFLVGHVAYVIGFWTDPPSAVAVAGAAVIVAAAIGPLARRILRALRDQRALRVPVASYMAVIAIMVASALASGNALAGAGAVLFAGSDSMIAWNRFVRPFPSAAVAVMVTYHVGQAFLVLSLLH
ncbi:MAG: lysoplasmalogenase [Actinomycetota bacterium]